MANTLTLSRAAATMAIVAMGSRRSQHAGAGWSMPVDASRLRQPQDGAVDLKSKMTTIRQRPQVGISQEPDDATLTGGTRSLTRRLLGLNVMSALRRSPAAAVVKSKVA